MSTSYANTRIAVAAGTACVTGAVVAPIVPIIGFPMCAGALAVLVYGGRSVVASFVAGLAVAVGAMLRPSDVAVLAPSIIAILVAVSSVREHRALNVSALLVPVMAVSFALGEFANAWMLGLSYRGYIAEVAAVMQPALQGLSAASELTADALVDTIVRFAPSGYFMLAVVTVVPVMMVIGWVARKADADVNALPRLEAIDLTPHVLWAPIVALSAMAAGRLLGEPEGIVATVGLNLLLAARVVLFVQGIGVVSAWLGKTKIGPVGRAVAYVSAFLIDATTWVVSMVGLIDFWTNLRKLPRQGEDTVSPDRPYAE